MSQFVETVSFGDGVGKKLDQDIDKHIVSDIMSFIYGDKKTVKQISRKLNIHFLKTTMYLDNLVREEFVKCVEEKGTIGIERFYYVESEDVNYDLYESVKEKEGLYKAASKLGNKFKEVVRSIEKEDINDVAYTVAMLTDNNAEKVLEAQRDLEKLIINLEDENKENEVVKKYNLMTAFAPYKD